MPNNHIGLFHPGNMGASLGGELVKNDNTVSWASQNRSLATIQRAKLMGLIDALSVDAVLASAEIVLSVCPPHAARELATQVAGFDGTFVDMNAISPEHSREISEIIHQGGGKYVDGGIIGLPVGSGEWTRLYLSGPTAGEIAALFRGTRIDTFVISEHIGDASALKLAYAAWTKGTDALLLAIRAFARCEGVDDSLLSEWSLGHPDLLKQSLDAAYKAASKGWRWVGEMEEIASSFAAAGIPEGFHLAAKSIFARSPGLTSDQTNDEILDLVLNAVRTE